MNLDFRVFDILSVIPGYHYFLHLFGKVFGLSSISFFRLINLVIGFCSIFVFFLLAFKIYKGFGFVRGLQYTFFPILFPFFFLIYTDVLSLLLVLLMFYFLLQKNYDIAGIFAILSFFVRQNNVLWMAFGLSFVYAERIGTRIDFKGFFRSIRDCWTFILGFVISLIFFIWNKGFALGNKMMNEGGIYFGNLFFALFLFFFLFLPLNIGNFLKIKELVKRNKWIWFIILVIFIFYLKFFIVNHPYNFINTDYFLRNNILGYFLNGIVLKSLLFLPIAYSILSLCTIRFKRREFYLLYPFAIFSLLPLWLIEQRYYLIPFSFFILFKKEESGLIEKLTIWIYLIFSFLLFYFIGSGKFFL